MCCLGVFVEVHQGQDLPIGKRESLSSGLTFLRFFRSMEESVLEGEEMRERIIIDADLPRATGEALRRAGHLATGKDESHIMRHPHTHKPAENFSGT